VIYFDHAATAGSRDQAVVAAVTRALSETSANPGRSGHRLSLAAARLVEDTRSRLAELVGAADPARLVFTKNATEALNLALFGRLRRGDRVLVSSWEHNAVMRPLRHLESTRDLQLEFIPPAAEGPLDLTWLEHGLRGEPVAMVVVQAASNVTGALMPVTSIGRLCRRHRAFFLVDAAQGAGVMDLHVDRDGIDALALTGHKSLGGPQGTGALCLSRPEDVEPLLRGGTGSRSESEQQPEFAPDRFEAGTQNVPGLAGLGAAVQQLLRTGLQPKRERHRRLAGRLLEKLTEVPGLRLFGPTTAEGRLATVSFVIQGLSTSQVARELERHDVLCRPGLHCAPRAHQTLGTLPEGTVRFSLCGSNTAEEIDAATAALAKIATSVA
jgi:cysteine desulfurase family protein